MLKRSILSFLQLHLVALNRPVSGRMRGIRGADYECHRQARSAGMRGTYRAFLSTTTQNLDSIIYYSRDRQIPIINKEVSCLLSALCLSVWREHWWPLLWFHYWLEWKTMRVYNYECVRLSVPKRPLTSAFFLGDCVRCFIPCVTSCHSTYFHFSFD